MSYTIRDLINNNKDENIAITSENNNVIKYSDLKKHIFNISGQLASQGITPSNRAAIVLPNGPEMATAFLSISSYMSAAPLNPSYKLKEYEFYLQDLMPKIVIVEKDSQNPAVEAAKNLGIEICEIKKIDNAPAGIFNLYNKTTNFETLPFIDNIQLWFVFRSNVGISNETIHNLYKFSTCLTL